MFSPSFLFLTFLPRILGGIEVRVLRQDTLGSIVAFSAATLAKGNAKMG
jgi:hypothetical protein